MSLADRFCAKCGAALQPGSAYCSKCGAPISKPADSAQSGAITAGQTGPSLSWRDQRRLLKLQRRAAKHGLSLAPPNVTTTIVEKEVVKVPCKFCHTLVPITGEVTKCPSCGAPITV